MTTDTSRDAVEALITEERASRPRFDSGRSLIVRLSNTLAALLDERDGYLGLSEHRLQLISEKSMRIRELEAERDNAIPLYEKDIRTLARRAERAEAERDVYKRAKAENDERFQIEAAEQRERADRLAAKLDAVKAAVERDAEDRRAERMQSTPVVAKATIRAILADTDEGNKQ